MEEAKTFVNGRSVVTETWIPERNEKKVEIGEEFHEILEQSVVLKKNAKRQILGCGEHKRSSKFFVDMVVLNPAAIDENVFTRAIHKYSHVSLKTQSCFGLLKKILTNNFWRNILELALKFVGKVGVYNTDFDMSCYKIKYLCKEAGKDDDYMYVYIDR